VPGQGEQRAPLLHLQRPAQLRRYNPDKEESMYTVGATAWRVDRVLPVKDLMAELAGS